MKGGSKQSLLKDAGFNKMNFCPREFNDSKIFGVATHGL